jgi:ABC-type Fe3+-hydroxamate transport system substrate-binding protein
MLYTDQIGHQFKLDTTPKRIISLVPSQTELLYDLGLDNAVVGITKFCIHPNDWFITKNRVGGTKTVDLEKVAALKPDIIIANKEENTESEIKALQKLYPVYTSDIANLEESLEMIQQIGEIAAKENESIILIQKIQDEFKNLTAFTGEKNKVLYLIWQDPYMSINQNTFINDMLNSSGFHNLIEGDKVYPAISENQINELNPDLIFLSSEPYPFKEKHLLEFKKQFLNARIVLVDGEYFSWYGSRLQNAPNYFKTLINGIS